MTPFAPIAELEILVFEIDIFLAPRRKGDKTKRQDWAERSGTRQRRVENQIIEEGGREGANKYRRSGLKLAPFQYDDLNIMPSTTPSIYTDGSDFYLTSRP